MKKKLNVDQIQSELRGGSAFFPGYKGRSDSPTPPSVEPEVTPPVQEAESQPPSTHHDRIPQGVPPSAPPPVPQGVPPQGPLIPKKARRPIRQRQPFDIYEDQYQSLKKIAEAERGYENGRSMGQMVREALDAYLHTHTSAD